ncbi:hypothetical protein TTHERM_001256493 (macronuclear) [Tetrahymena thermophila SB210]|uniref:Uncharacterized protein n=1 Tax=Tetrahymena thermophila (strain SB210) TaxID=312017 RepID=W7XC87_TETTS|nr:hypothetical protein TTHERM_001256493 [Tetrahymena thermophila SB210]EWS75032.1 hypothetical protein TTHERM_001256493 [Tetrahymena thermophila SB210]|eukprot:XP_012652431.1 hypothetical protein TTHERM_001256493 [Tetrahymena thermophila SB210]
MRLEIFFNGSNKKVNKQIEQIKLSSIQKKIQYKFIFFFIQTNFRIKFVIAQRFQYERKPLHPLSKSKAIQRESFFKNDGKIKISCIYLSLQKIFLFVVYKKQIFLTCICSQKKFKKNKKKNKNSISSNIGLKQTSNHFQFQLKPILEFINNMVFKSQVHIFNTIVMNYFYFKVKTVKKSLIFD